METLVNDFNPHAMTWTCTHTNQNFFHEHTSNWMAPWKKRISSTSIKLRKSLGKPVMWQNIWY